MRYKPPTIRQTGLRKYLNQTAKTHNTFKFDDFVKMIEAGVNKSNIAKAFGVDRKTVDRWLEIYNEEKA